MIVVAAVRARRRALARQPRPVRVQSVRLDSAAVQLLDDDPATPGRVALDAPHRLDGWPTAGQLSQLPLDRRGDGPARNS